MDLVKTGILILLGAFLCSVLIIPDIIMLSNQATHNAKVMDEIQSIRDEMALDRLDRLLKEGMDAKLEAIQNE